MDDSDDPVEEELDQDYELSPDGVGGIKDWE